ncbi:MAG TPA: hypothetical protein VGV18_03075, partial [Verrucomicrobiae bacterium]|nr:hypothetical protein [Verrucomicrobiae bacterium]
VPMNLKLQNLDHKITENKRSFESRTSEFEARNEENALKISEQLTRSREHSRQIASLFERVQWIEISLNVPKRPEIAPGQSAAEDTLK